MSSSDEEGTFGWTLKQARKAKNKKPITYLTCSDFSLRTL